MREKKSTTMSPKSHTFGYMCGIAWQHEVGNTDVKIYTTKKELVQEHPFTHECGIVKVKLTLERWVRKQKI